jgi:hypothetical protein
MKARLLKKLLNDTGYTVSNKEGYIAVGSPLCHNLISVDKKTLKVKYALDTFSEGRKALAKTHYESTDNLLFIWDKLHELIASGEIQDIINGKDEIENPLPVFTVNSAGELIESVTDKYGWPNTDDDGICMYNNTHFPTKEQAIKSGISEFRACVDGQKERVAQIEEDLLSAKANLERYQRYVENLSAQLDDTFEVIH